MSIGSAKLKKKVIERYYFFFSFSFFSFYELC